MSKTILGITVVAAGAALAGLGATLPADSARAPVPWKTEYKPVQSIAREFGSKSVSGYFLTRDRACAVTLMLSERADPEAPPVLTAARLRLTLKPGEAAGLDSEEGHTLTFVCGEAGKTLAVDSGDRRMVAVHRQLAQRPAPAEVR